MVYELYFNKNVNKVNQEVNNKKVLIAEKREMMLLILNDQK